jgi:hypothetical protein
VTHGNYKPLPCVFLGTHGNPYALTFDRPERADRWLWSLRASTFAVRLGKAHGIDDKFAVRLGMTHGKVFRSNRNLENSACGLAHVLFVPPGQVNRFYWKKDAWLSWLDGIIVSRQKTLLECTIFILCNYWRLQNVDRLPAVPQSAFLVVG